ncbi:thiolase family protein [Deinococcus yavapaiensis]|uniref:acetyl-CoA C-acyltransferase n=1 Tax=Deinococcus yavapaiensis KR-236 TaxID=694435 RepID=A0A318SPW2_9DEIO|nr:thiolase family protein [Deinococcus yavapaiensis]PYE54863.1 3-ketoacyl-CoA thiolase [Deinococcus yavapaiensis KR-236]
MTQFQDNDAVIVSAVRTPVGRGIKGTLANTRSDELAALAVREAVSRAGIDPALVEDLVLGCAFPEAEQGLNVARLVGLRAGLPDEVAGVTVNRFCSSGLQTIAQAAANIRAGWNDVIVAGGLESMTMVPQTGNVFSPNPGLVDERPGAYMSMGLTAENVAQQYGVSREEQDEFAYRSHQKAAAAQDAGRFQEEIVPVPVRVDKVKNGKVTQETVMFEHDELVRRDTNLEALGKLRPAFNAKGSVTAGNSSPYSDGAAAAVVMSGRKAQELGLKPLGRFVSFAVGGVAPEIMGMGPIAAVPKALKLAGLTMADIDLVELNEAFASQSLAVIRELGMDPEKVNVNGGAIALGHPEGATGAKLAATLLHELRRRGGRYGIVTMCVGGGQGAAAVFEAYSA